MKKTVRRLEQGPKFNLVIIAVLAVFCTLVGIVIMSSRAATEYVIPSNIESRAGSCDPSQPDVTRAIHNWLSTVPSNSTAKLGANRCYRTEGIIQVSTSHDPKVNFTLDGNGSKLQAFTDGCEDQSNDGIEYNHCKYGTLGLGDDFSGNWPRNRVRINFRDGRNLTVRNLKLEGGHPNPGPEGAYDPDLEAQHAFNIEDSQNVLIENNRADRVWGDFVYVGGSDSANITVQNNVFGEDNGSNSGNGRQGLAIVDGENITFKNNRLSNIRRSTIDLESNSDRAIVKNVVIENNFFGPGRLNFVANHGFNAIFENIFVRNNTLQGKVLGGSIRAPYNPDPNNPSTYRRRNYQFTGNTSDTQCGSPGGACIIVHGVDGVVANNNNGRVQIRCGSCAKMVLIQPNRARNISVIGNKMLRAEMTGRYVTNPEGEQLLNVNFCERDNQGLEPLRPIPNSQGAPACAAPDNPPNITSFNVNPTTVTLGQTVNLSAIATDDKGIKHVDFYRGFNLISRDEAAPYATILNTSGLPLGNHNLFAKATDTANQSKDSNIVRLVTNAAGTTTTPGGGSTGGTTSGSKTGSSIIPGPVGQAIDKVADVIADIPVIGSVVPQIEETIEQLSEGRPWLKPLLGSVFLGIGIVLLLVIAYVIWRKLRRWRKSKEPPKLGGSGSEQTN